jgi:RNA polymerase sigma-70 factor (ECF subfamily)
MEDPDVALMLRVREGDEDAFRDLFRKHCPHVLRFVRRHVGEGAIADELVQDVFTQMYRARGRYRPDARFTTWLYTIALNICRNERRRPEHQLRVRPDKEDAQSGADPILDPIDDAAPTAEEVVAGQELEDRIQAALQRLPEKQRSALLLSRVDGLAYRDVASVLGCTEGAVKALLFRATQTLKRDLLTLVGER